MEAQPTAKRKYTPRKPASVTCLQCGSTFETTGQTPKYCTSSCKDKARYVRDREKRLTAVQTYRKEHRVAISERRRAAYTLNKDKFRRLSAASYLRHRDVRVENALRYQRENRHVVVARNARRRYREEHERKSVSVRDLTRLVGRFDGGCAYCRRPLSAPGRGFPDSLQWDHIIPVSRGGRHSIGNLAPSCRTCNSSKSAKFLVEWTSRWYLNGPDHNLIGVRAT